MSASPFERVPYIAEIEPVREVSLVGSADLEFWTEPLARVGLFPKPLDGRAQVVLSAMGSKFRGISFRELCISVVAQVAGSEAAGDALYVVQAFNSSRLFTFCERVFFSTPYRHAALDVSMGEAAAFDLRVGPTSLLQARFSAANRNPAEPLRTSAECFEGPIFLPPQGSRDEMSPRFFRARIAGQTTIWTNDAIRDMVEFAPDGASEVFDSLRASGFAIREWHLRPAANHARSKTFRCRKAELG